MGLLWNGAAFAELVWEAKVIELTSDLDAEPVTGRFVFRNDGDRDVTITSIHAACGCTTTTLEKTTYKPGESGYLEAVFTPGDRRGPQSKNVIVVTDGPGSPAVRLAMKVEIPTWVEIEPRLLLWGQGEHEATQTIEIKIHEDRPFLIEGLKTDEPQLAVEIKEIEKGRHYQITVTPRVSDAIHRVVYLQPKIEEDYREKAEESMRFLVRSVGKRAESSAHDAPAKE